jgi:polar amino acid transport system substrate-binding protein
MKQEGLYQQIVGSYMFPILLGITISQPWFFFIEILGIIAFAAAGFITAKKEGYSLIGTFFIAGLPAIGGGVMRDLLISRDHIFIISTPEYIYTIVWVVACGYFLLRLYDLLHWLLRDKLHLATSALQKSIAYKVIQFPWVQVLDALGLSCFTIVGVVVAVEARLTPLLFWGPLLGMFTCILGGIVQNMVRGNTNIAVLRGLLYPEISLLWGFILCLFIRWEATRLYINEVYLAVILCLIGGFLTRLIMMKFKIKGPML